MKINKTTIVGIITILWAIASAFLIQKQIVTVEQSTAIGAVLVSFGLIAAKDGDLKNKS